MFRAWLRREFSPCRWIDRCLDALVIVVALAAQIILLASGVK